MKTSKKLGTLFINCVCPLEASITSTDVSLFLYKTLMMGREDIFLRKFSFHLFRSAH